MVDGFLISEFDHCERKQTTIFNNGLTSKERWQGESRRSRSLKFSGDWSATFCWSPTTTLSTHDEMSARLKGREEREK